jgi:hypothetical protein
MKTLAWLSALSLLAWSVEASAQAGLPAAPPGYGAGPAPVAPAAAAAPAQYGYPAGYGYSAPYASSSSARRSGVEIGLLYATAVVYGVGLGVWLDAEIGVEDPGIFLIAPAVLGVAAPAGVYVLDTPAMRRGLAGAIAAGAVVGAGEGIGISSFQFVTANKEDAWGFRGLARATAIGATLGAAGGAVLGTVQTPSPRSSVLITSGVTWGSAIGAMFGYGGSTAGVGYGSANDKAALGGLIGYNVGLVATGALSTVYIPTTSTLEWMWAGAGIGFAASLPVYLFYAGKDQPPAKRGLIFSGTATTLGIAAGAIFTAGSREEARRESERPALARVTAVGPLTAPGAMGLSVAGELQ